MPPLDRDIEREEDMSSSDCECVRRSAEDALTAMKRSSSSRKPSDIKVAFRGEEPSIQEIPHYSDFTPEECGSMWCTPEDYASFRLDMTDTILIMKHHPDLIDEYRLTACGLECRARDAVEKRHQVKFQAWSAVFEEQNNQRNAGDRDEFLISTLYSQYAREAKDEAVSFAKQLEEELAGADKQDEFDDSWISDIASCSQDMSESSESFSSSYYEKSALEPTFDDDDDENPFNDSWIMDVANAPAF
jgi:hypothetical protein